MYPVIQKTTAKAPADRYPDVISLAEAFRQAATPAAAITEPDDYATAVDLPAEALSTMLPGMAVLDERTTALGLLEIENPYKGLRAFQEADAGDFFGREALVARLLERLDEAEDNNRFLAVVGPSGSGKSSVVRAGLIPALRDGALPGSDKWFMIQMIPGGHPFEELEAALLRVAVNPPETLLTQLKEDERGLIRAVKRVLPGEEDSELLLVVDQFEELFTLAGDDTRTLFLDSLLAASLDPRSRIRVVITLRADFYDRPLNVPSFGELFRKRNEAVLPLTAEELSRAIIKPAARVDVMPEPGLVEAIVSDVGEQPGALPLLQYALTELFDRREELVLTRAAYQDSGGVLGALSRRAEDLFTGLDETQQEAARQMFLRLVTLGEGTEDTRRRVGRSELAAGDAVDAVIQVYGEARLLTFDRDPISREPTLEVAHEAITTVWARFHTWLAESRHDIRQQRLLTTTAVEWEQADKDPSYLLRGTRLEQFADWADGASLALTQHERNFLETSLKQQAQEQETEHERQIRELDLAQQAAQSQRRAAHQLRYLVAGLVVFLTVAVVLTVLAFGERDNALHQAEVNHSLVLARNSQDALEGGDTDLALLLARESIGIDNPPEEAIRALREVAFGIGTRAILRQQGNSVEALAISPNTRWALSGSCAEIGPDDNCVHGELILWNIETLLGHPLEGHMDWVDSVAFSPDGQTAFSASRDNTIFLWDIATGEIIRHFEGHLNGVNAVVFSPDGSIALSGGGCGARDDENVCTVGEMFLWDVETGEIIHRLEDHTGGVNTVTFSADGLVAVSGSDDTTLIIWDLDPESESFGEPIRTIEGHTSAVNTVVINPTTGAIISGGDDLVLRQWDMNTGEEISYSFIITQPQELAVSADGRTILMAGDWELRMLDGEIQQIVQLLYDHSPTYIRSAAMSQDGRLALSGGEDGTLRLWNMKNDTQLRQFTSEGWRGGGHIHGDYLFSVSWEGWVEFKNLETGDLIGRFAGHPNWTTGAILIPPDEDKLLVISSNWGGGADGHLWLVYDIATGEEILRVEDEAEYNDYASQVSHDGRLFLSGTMQWVTGESGDGEAIIFDLATGEKHCILQDTEDVSGVDFNADDTQVLTSSFVNHNVTLWDVETCREIRRYEHNYALWWVKFAPNNTYIVGTDDGNALIQVDIDTGEIVQRFLGHRDYPWRLAISPDGRHLVSGDLAGTIILWDIKTGKEVRRFAHDAAIGDVRFNLDGQTISSHDHAGTIRQWPVTELPLHDIIDWIEDNRYLRNFTCEERELYRIKPLCEQ
ncbi:AAA family ATPase [Chloroflexota bacterium]